MEQESLGKGLMIIGLIILVVGVIIYFVGEKLSFLGKLPGDIRVETENFRFYVPITTMMLLSLVISALVRLIQHFR